MSVFDDSIIPDSLDVFSLCKKHITLAFGSVMISNNYIVSFRDDYRCIPSVRVGPKKNGEMRNVKVSSIVSPKKAK